jgi:hypothetical protein
MNNNQNTPSKIDEFEQVQSASIFRLIDLPQLIQLISQRNHYVMHRLNNPNDSDLCNDSIILCNQMIRQFLNV